MAFPTDKNYSAPMEGQTLSIPSLSLRKNFSWTLAGNIVYAACQWAMLSIIAKLGDPVMVGQFALGLAVTAPVIIFSQLQLRVVQVTDVKNDYSYAEYFSLRFLLTLIAMVVITGLAFLGGYRWETTLVIFLVGLSKSVESISDIIYGLMQKYERMDRIAKSLMIKGPASLLALGMGVYLSGKVFWGVVGLIVAWTLLLLTYDSLSVKMIANAFHGNKNAFSLRPYSWKNLLQSKSELFKMWQLVWISLPLGFVMMINSLKTNIPRYYIEHYLGERELGLFTAIAYIMVAGKLINNALGASASPRLAKYYTSGNSSKFSGLLIKLSLIGLGVGLLGTLIVMVAGKPILSIIYKPEYAQHVDLFVWVTICSAINFAGGFLGHGMTAARYFRILAAINVGSILIIIVSSYLLIPSFGLIGAAYALGVVASFDVVLKAIILLHAIKDIKK